MNTTLRFLLPLLGMAAFAFINESAAAEMTPDNISSPAPAEDNAGAATFRHSTTFSMKDGEEPSFIMLNPGEACYLKQLPAGKWQCSMEQSAGELLIEQTSEQGGETSPLPVDKSLVSDQFGGSTYQYTFEVKTETDVRLSLESSAESQTMLIFCRAALPTAITTVETQKRTTTTTTRKTTYVSESGGDSSSVVVWLVFPALLAVIGLGIALFLKIRGKGSAVAAPHPAIASAEGPGMITVTITTYERDARNVYIIAKRLITSEPIIIGKSSACHIRLKDSGVASRHCQLCSDANKLSVAPLSGKTELNNRTLSRGSVVHIHPGDCIRLGDTLISFIIHR